PEEFWEVHANLTTPKSEAVRFEVVKENGETFRPLNKQQTDQALAQLQGASYKVVKRDARPTSTKPGPPFITSTLQQAASTRLGFSVKKTMMMAQRLYEAGYITYMRTDSTNLSADAVSMARGYIEKTFGSQYLPESPNVYGSKANAQEAHEAIRPSEVKLKST